MQNSSVGKCALIDELNHPITLNPQLIVLKILRLIQSICIYV